MHLQNYGEKLGHSNVVTSAYSIFYYGVRSLNGEISFTGDELDEHFGFQIRPAMECANQYFHEKLLELIHDSPSDTAGD